MYPAGVHKDALGCEDSAKDKHCVIHVITSITGLGPFLLAMDFMMEINCVNAKLSWNNER
jgi:hypothetical protein